MDETEQQQQKITGDSNTLTKINHGFIIVKV